MVNWNAYEKEEEILQQQLAEGTIDLKEFNKRMGDIQRDARDDAQEEAESAYRQSMEANGYY